MAAVTKNVDLYELKDAKVYALTADGAALTYGTGQDIPGIMSLAVSAGDTRQIKLVGDNKIRRIAGRILSIKIRATHSAASFDVFATLTGGTAAAAGTTPTTTSSFTQKGADQYGYIKIAGLIANAKDIGTENGANAILTVYKAKLTAQPGFTSDEKGMEWSWEAEAIPTEFDDKIWDITVDETAATLP